MRRYCALLLMLTLCIAACRKKDLPAPSSPSVTEPIKDSTHTEDSTAHLKNGSVLIKWNHVAGSAALKADGTTLYTAPNGDQYTVKKFAYYVSNVVLIDEKGKRFTEPNSYRLIDITNESLIELKMDNIPAAQYTGIEIMIGVDSLRNVSGVQFGALDPAHGMFWSWSSGYIMAKMEGSSPQSSLSDGFVSYHIAGFKGAYNALQTVHIKLPQKAGIHEGAKCTVFLQSDLNTWFSTPGFPGFSALSSIGTEGADALKVAQNYQKMVTATKVENL